MQFQFSKKQPLTLNNYNDKFIFTNKREFDAYDNFLFENQIYLKGGATYQSWNQVTITLTYTENLWHELSKTNYVKIMVEGTFSAQYYFINNYSIIQKNRISVTAILDVWMTYHTQIVFKENASVFVDRMSINRWKDKVATILKNQYYLIPNWSSESALWQPETKLTNMDNKIFESVYPLNLSLPNTYIGYDDFLYQGEFVYFVFKYNTDSEVGKINYTPATASDQLTFKANPMPFFILPLGSTNTDLYKDFVDSPYLQGIFYSQLPWFYPIPYPPDHVFSDDEKKLNPLVAGVNWKNTWNETLPTDFIKYNHIIRGDLINSFFINKGDLIFEMLTKQATYDNFGFLRDKTKFNPINEPKLYMYPYFEIDYVKGKRQELVIHNERLFSNINDIVLDQFPIFKVNVLETFTPYFINSYRYINSGLYNTSSTDLKYSVDLSGANNLLSLSSAYKTFLNSYLANYNTGLNQKGFNTGVGVYGGLMGIATGAIAGASLGPLGALGGAIVGGIGGIVNMIQHTGDNAFAQQQQKNQLIDLARQPDTVNKNNNPDTYLEISLLRENKYAGTVRTRTLNDYNKYQVALYFHKFGYTYNRNLIVDNWDKLLIRDTWNYIQIEQFSNCVDLEKSNIPWQAILQIDEIFKQGIRLWNHFTNYETGNKLFDYDLPNWEKGIIWGDEKFEISSTNGSMIWERK